MSHPTVPVVPPYHGVRWDNDRLLRCLLNASAEAILATNPDRVLIYVNPAAERMFGYSSLQLVGQPLGCIIKAEFRRLGVASSNSDGDSDDSRMHSAYRQVSGSTADGELLDLEVAIVDSDMAEFHGHLLFLRDRGSFTEMESRYEQQVANMKALTDMLPMGLLQLNSLGDCVYSNPEWCELSGITHDESLLRGWRDAFHPEDVQRVVFEIHQALVTQADLQLECDVLSPLGRRRPVAVSGRPIVGFDGRAMGMLVLVKDNAAVKKRVSALEQSASYDALTGLLNKMAFERALRKAIASAPMPSRSSPIPAPATTARGRLFYIDLDGFKGVNDTLGHNAGDELLRQVAKRLKRLGGEDDLIARLGGDEFVLYRPLCHCVEHNCSLGERILEEMQRPFVLNGIAITIGASIGVAAAREGIPLDELLHNADVAMYQAKEAGKNKLRLYFDDQTGRDAKGQQLDALLRAVDAGRVEPRCQVVMSLLGGHVSALLLDARWQNGAERLSLRQCQQLLRQSGAVTQMMSQLLVAAAEQAPALVSAARGKLCLVVPLMVPELLRPPAVATLVRDLAMLVDVGLEVVVGIPELQLRDLPMVHQAFDRFRGAGCRSALLDMGEGRCSLSALVDHHFHWLFLAGTLVNDAEGNRRARVLLQCLTDSADSLQMSVVACKVSSEDMLPFLRKQGVSMVMDDRLALDLSAEGLAELLRSRALPSSAGRL